MRATVRRRRREKRDGTSKGLYNCRCKITLTRSSISFRNSQRSTGLKLSKVIRFISSRPETRTNRGKNTRIKNTVAKNENLCVKKPTVRFFIAFVLPMSRKNRRAVKRENAGPGGAAHARCTKGNLESKDGRKARRCPRTCFQPSLVNKVEPVLFPLVLSLLATCRIAGLTIPPSRISCGCDDILLPRAANRREVNAATGGCEILQAEVSRHFSAVLHRSNDRRGCRSMFASAYAVPSITDERKLYDRNVLPSYVLSWYVVD